MASRSLLMTVTFVALSGIEPLPAHEFASPSLAKRLTVVMANNGLEAIAARDPREPTRVTAALAFPGSQLLVVSGPYPDLASLDQVLANRQYRDVYSVLQQPSITAGKVFFQDLGCDGLRTGDDGSVDILYENGKTQTVFNGDWKSQRLTQTVYEKRLQDADARYAQLLTDLLSALQQNALHPERPWTDLRRARVKQAFMPVQSSALKGSPPDFLAVPAWPDRTSAKRVLAGPIISNTATDATTVVTTGPN